MTDIGDKAREDFFSEAQEIIESLSRDLLLLDTAAHSGAVDPDLVNEVFRHVHTLKGLSGLFNATRLGTLSHELENLLDDLRMGRVQLSGDLLDLLFRAVEMYGRLLAAEKGGEQAAGVDEFDPFMLEIQKSGTRRAVQSPTLAYDLDPGMLAVLTEYEEHRLRNNIQRGLKLYRVRVVFDLATIDAGLESLKSRLKALGEILTYLPTGTGADAESIEIDILLASHESLDSLKAAIEAQGIRIDEVPKRATEGPGPSPDRMHSELAPESIAIASVAPEAPLKSSSDMPMQHKSLSDRAVAVRGPDASLRSVAQTVRVDIQKLDHLMSLLGEMAILKGMLGRLADKTRHEPGQRETASELARLHHTFDRQLSAMQGGILEVRMVPLGQVFEKLARVVRQLSRELDKDANLIITGAETEVDKLIVEDLSDPLMHMVRNALDHGIEARQERAKVGKPAVATIALNAFQKGNQVVVEVEDDGRGVDDHALVKAALSSGILSPEEAQEISRHDALGLLFMPGVTTRKDVGKHSGRGVGMDVVKTNIARLGGVVDAQSEPGIGTKFTITLPITLAIIGALLVDVAGGIFAVPLSSVQEAVTVDPSSVRLIEGREVVTLRGESLPLCRLDVAFQVRDVEESLARPGKMVIVIASASARRCGFVVDRILGRQDIVIKALGGPLKALRGFAGATELGDERVGLVIDTPFLIEEALAVSTRAGVVAHA
ncbi:MAG: chemotaxis protein CheA [Deltaproteobacteria bacterium]|nr:chemotaxis protein CheA [Deltaproteobacteria bacterium]